MLILVHVFKMISQVENTWQLLGVNTCQVCQFKASQIGVFQSHICRKKQNQIAIRYKKQEKVYVCDVCKIEKNEYDFTEHLQCHLQERPFQCSFCTEDFEMKIEVYRHFIKSHSHLKGTYTLKTDEHTKSYLEIARNKGFAFISVKRKGNVMNLTEPVQIYNRGVTSTIQPSLIPRQYLVPIPAIVFTQPFREAHTVLNLSVDKNSQINSEQNDPEFAKTPSKIIDESNKIDQNITKKDQGLELEPAIEVSSKENEYPYLNLRFQNNKIVYTCFKCKLKFLDKVSFHKHIWKTHVHASHDFSCCSSTYTFTCHQLQRVLKILNEKSMGLFESHLESNKDAVTVKREIFDEGADKNSLSLKHLTPVTASGYVSESAQTKSSAIIIDEPSFIKQLKMRIETIENNKETVAQKSDSSNSAIQKNACASKFNGNSETEKVKTNGQENNEISKIASTESQIVDNLRAENSIHACKSKRGNAEIETFETAVQGDNEGSLITDSKSQIHSNENLVVENHAAETDISKESSEYELSVIRTQGGIDGANTSGSKGLTTEFLMPEMHSNTITCKSNKTTSDEASIQNDYECINRIGLKSQVSHRLTATVSINTNEFSERNPDSEMPSFEPPEEHVDTVIVSSKSQKCHLADPLTKSTLVVKPASEPSKTNLENEIAGETFFLENNKRTEVPASKSLKSDNLMAAEHISTIEPGEAIKSSETNSDIEMPEETVLKNNEGTDVPHSESLLSDNLVTAKQVYSVESDVADIENDRNLECCISTHVSEKQKHQPAENPLLKEDLNKSGPFADNNSFYKCAFINCDFLCHSPVDFLTHSQNTHGMESTFSCFYCGFEGQNISCLLDHMEYHLLSSSYSITVSSNSFVGKFEDKNLKTVMGLIESVSKTLHNVKLKCNLCQLQLLSFEELKDHLESSTLKTYSCKHCRGHFLNVKSFETHIREQHPGLARFRRQLIHLLCKDRADNHKNYAKLSKIKKFLGNFTSRQNSEDQQNSIPDDSSSNILVEKPSTPDTFHTDLQVKTNVKQSGTPSQVQVIPPENCRLSGDHLTNNAVALDANVNTIPSAVRHNTFSPQKTLSSSVTGFAQSHEESFCIESTPAACSNKNIKSSKPTQFDNITEAEPAEDIFLNSCNFYQEDLTSSATKPNSQSLENLSEHDSLCSKSRIFDICAKTKTAKYLSGLFKKIDDGSFSCNECAKKFQRLRSMLCHIFYCQGKISVVNCPYDCSFESEHPKMVAQHIQKKHPGKNPECKSFRKINGHTFFQSLKNQKVTQLILKQACMPFAGNNLMDNTQNNSNGGHSFGVTEMTHGCIRSKSWECESESVRVEPSDTIPHSDMELSQGGKGSKSSELFENAHCPHEILHEHCSNGDISRGSTVTEKKEKETMQPSMDSQSSHLKSVSLFCEMNSKYQCKLCHIILDYNLHIMKEHIKEQHELFLCGYCEIPYSKLFMLYNHIKFVHNNKPKYKPIPINMIFNPVDNKAVSGEKMTMQEKENRDRSSEVFVMSVNSPDYSEEENANGWSPRPDIREDTLGVNMAEKMQHDSTERKLCDSSNNNLNATKESVLTVVRASDLNCQDLNATFHRCLDRKEILGSKTQEMNSIESQGRNGMEHNGIGGKSGPNGRKESCKMFTVNLNEMVCGEWIDKVNSFGYEKRHDQSDEYQAPFKKICDESVKSAVPVNERLRGEIHHSDERPSNQTYNDTSSHDDSNVSNTETAMAKEHCPEITNLALRERDSQKHNMIERNDHDLQLNQQCQFLKYVNGEATKNNLIWKIFTCGFCKVSLPTISEVKSHCRENHSHSDVHWIEKRTNLDYSDDGEKLYDQADTRPGVARYLCGYCAFQSEIKESMANHMDIAHNKMQYHYMFPVCYDEKISYTEKCNIGDEKNPSVCLHEVVMTSERSQNPTQLQYRCHICDMCLNSEFLFRLHLAKHGGFKHCSVLHTTRGLLLCAICGYIACSSIDLASHVSNHMKERRYSCSACDFDDHRIKGVYVHIRKYHGEISTASVIDNKVKKKDIEIRPRLVSLQPEVCLTRIDDYYTDVQYDSDSSLS